MTQITIIDKDIKGAFPGSCSQCPIAKAIRRTKRGYYWYVVTNVVIDPEGYAVLLPPIAQEFRWKFDHGLEVKPISFQLDI